MADAEAMSVSEANKTDVVEKGEEATSAPQPATKSPPEPSEFATSHFTGCVKRWTDTHG